MIEVEVISCDRNGCVCRIDGVLSDISWRRFAEIEDQNGSPDAASWDR